MLFRSVGHQRRRAVGSDRHRTVDHVGGHTRLGRQPGRLRGLHGGHGRHRRIGAIEQIDFALAQVNTARSSFGAAQNRFESIISNLQVAGENQASARSRIMDADFASETASMTRAQVLQQAGVAMLSQANAIPNNVLSLLR